jgi:hypothetical protein
MLDRLKFAVLLVLVAIWIGLLWVVTALRGRAAPGDRRQRHPQD